MSERTKGLWASSPHPADDALWIVHVLGDFVPPSQGVRKQPGCPR